MLDKTAAKGSADSKAYIDISIGRCMCGECNYLLDIRKIVTVLNKIRLRRVPKFEWGDLQAIFNINPYQSMSKLSKYLEVYIDTQFVNKTK